MLYIMGMVFSALTIYLVFDAYRKNSELKKFRTGIIIAVTLMSLTIVSTAIAIVFTLIS
jgi:predicted branched-subunit amino acid permease